jgi:hypothetical protein
VLAILPEKRPGGAKREDALSQRPTRLEPSLTSSTQARLRLSLALQRLPKQAASGRKAATILECRRGERLAHLITFIQEAQESGTRRYVAAGSSEWAVILPSPAVISSCRTEPVMAKANWLTSTVQSRAAT